MNEFLTSIPRFALALSGLTLPGYALARALCPYFCLAAAFPFSSLLICLTVILLALFGQSITLSAVGTILALLTLIFGGISLYCPPVKQQRTTFDSNYSEAVPGFSRLTIAATILLVLIVAFRTTLYPIGGFDTYTRWDALARAILDFKSLSFYPPLSPEDFTKHLIPDGFPPLVASVYWWSYAAAGTPAPQLTALSVTLQLLSILALTFKAAEYACNLTAARLSLLALMAAPLLLTSVEIGQESGFLALSVSGQICFSLAATRNKPVSAVFAAALFAALGSQAREYGAALALPGFLILLADAETRHHAWKYALVASLFSAPWYLRNWVVTGNPLYSHAIPGGFPINNGLIVIMNYYQEVYSPVHFSSRQWFAVLGELLTGTTITMIIGVPYLISHYRTAYPYLISAVLIMALWVWSIGQTCGGVIYSMRVLAPLVVVLAIVTGISAQKYFTRSDGRMRFVLVALFFSCFCYSALSALAYPDPIRNILSSAILTKTELPELSETQSSFIEQIKALDLPPAGIITESAYLARLLLSETRLRPVMPWNPDIDFLLNPVISVDEIHARLAAKNIRYAAVSRSSMNNGFFNRIPAYDQYRQSWSLRLTAFDEWALFEFPNGKERIK
jgi:hypothetical protein